MVQPFVWAPNFVSVTPSMGVLFPILRRGKVSTLWSSFFLSGIILSEVTQSQKNSNDMYSLISGYLPRNRISKIQDTICKTHEAQEERRSRCGYFAPSWNWEQGTHGRSYRDRVYSWDERMFHLEAAIPGDPSHNQPPNADTIAYTSKLLLKGPLL